MTSDVAHGSICEFLTLLITFFLDSRCLLQEEFVKRNERYTAAGVPMFSTPLTGGCYVCQATSCEDGTKLKVCGGCKVRCLPLL